MANSKSHEEQCRLVMDALAESIAELSDFDLEQEFKEEPPPRTKQILKEAAKRQAQTKLRAARARLEESRQTIHGRSYDLPKTPEQQRAMLDAVITWQQASGSVMLTAQFRDLKSASDSDVESALRQLEVLGILQKFRNLKSP